MKQTLLILFLAFSFSLSAQLALAPEEVTMTEAVDLTDEFVKVVAISELENTSNASVELRWEITKLSGPPEWTAQVCDAVNCYGWDVPSNISPAHNTNNALPLAVGAHSILDPAVRPNGVVGTGVYQIDVALASDPTNILVTGTYTFHILDETTSVQDFDQSSVKIFPNPASNFFQITDNEYVRQIEIFNIVGKKMNIADYVSGQSFDVANLPIGLYLVRMLDKDGEILKTSRLTKR